MDDFAAKKITDALGMKRGLVTCQAWPHGIEVRVFGRPEIRNLGADFPPHEWADATKLSTAIAIKYQAPLLTDFVHPDRLQ